MLECLVMTKLLSHKEREEVATKGFVLDVVGSLEVSLDEKIDQKLEKKFQEFSKEFHNYILCLMEDNRRNIDAIIENFRGDHRNLETRVEKLESEVF